jgi:hypothetical protein
MSAPIQQDELNPSDPKISAAPEYYGVEMDAPTLQPSLNVIEATHSQNSEDWTINQNDVLVADASPKMRDDWSAIEYHGVRITAIVSAVAVVAWTAVCVVLALSRLDTNNFGVLRDGLAFANDTLGERLQAANTSLHKVSRQVLSPTLAAWETTGTVNAELPLAIEVKNYTPRTAINVSGLPAGTTLSSGDDAGSGQWRIAVDDLPNTRVIPPRDYVGPMTLFVELRNDDDRAVVRLPLRLTWRRAATESTGTVENPNSPPLEASVVNDTPEQVVPEGAIQRDLTAPAPQSESPAPVPPSIKSSKSQRLAKKRRHKTLSSEPEPQTGVDPGSNLPLPLPLFGNIFANDGGTRDRKPAWNNDYPNTIDRSWDRCREPFDCSREIRR